MSTEPVNHPDRETVEVPQGAGRRAPVSGLFGSLAAAALTRGRRSLPAQFGTAEQRPFTSMRSECSGSIYGKWQEMPR
jgi:hypothetical protein